MQIKSFLWTLGLGMAGGVAAVAVISSKPKARKAVSEAADTVTDAVDTVRDSICG